MPRLVPHSSKFLTLAMLLVSCSGADRPSGQSAGPHPLSVDVEVRIMTFNIEWGGTNISFDNVVEAIRRSKADIVGIQEAEGNLERLATALGWQFDRRNYVVSRFPLFDPPGADGRYVLAEVTPGYVIAIANLHLPSDPYGPDMVRDGAPLDEVLANELAVRMPALQPYLEILPRLVNEGMPTFVTGDFNSPSHTDWTAAMVGKRAFLHYAVEWPVSRAMEQSGFTDAWRALYPGVADKPGLTWWAGRPPLAAYAPGDNDARDRIDLIWYAGRAMPLSAQLVGEEGGPGVAVSVSPWPSDHRGVVTTFAVSPVRPPNFVTTDRRVYRQGDKIKVIYGFTGVSALDISTTALRDDRAVMTRRTNDSRGEFELPAASSGHYLVETTIGRTNYRREFWVLKPDAVPSVEVSGARFETGQPVEVRWRNAPGNRNDYLAIYADKAGGDIEDMLAYAYVDARPEGSSNLSAFMPVSGGLPSEGAWPLSPGIYVAKLMKDDGFEVLAESASFEVQQP